MFRSGLIWLVCWALACLCQLYIFFCSVVLRFQNALKMLKMKIPCCSECSFFFCLHLLICIVLFVIFVLHLLAGGRRSFFFFCFFILNCVEGMIWQECSCFSRNAVSAFVKCQVASNYKLNIEIPFILCVLAKYFRYLNKVNKPFFVKNFSPTKQTRLWNQLQRKAKTIFIVIGYNRILQDWSCCISFFLHVTDSGWCPYESFLNISFFLWT